MKRCGCSLHSFFLLTTLPCICLSAAQHASAQLYQQKVIEYVRLIAAGNSAVVAPKIAGLRQKIPETAGLVYIEGLLASDDHTAIQYFRAISDSFPRSEWADDALARLFELYLSRGRTGDAMTEMEQLRSRYPTSPYLTSNYLTNSIVSTIDDTISGESRTSGTEFAIQVGAFSIKTNAENLQRQFRNDGYRTDIYENLLDGHNLLYLVWIGSFRTRDDAERTLAEIKSKYNIDGILRTRSSWKKW
jgi:hypothetical protein